LRRYAIGLRLLLRRCIGHARRARVLSACRRSAELTADLVEFVGGFVQNAAYALK
jgi:hypothetical protein